MNTISGRLLFVAALFVSVIAFFYAVAFSSAASAGSNGSNGSATLIYYCKEKPPGTFKTKIGKEKKVLKKIAEDPGQFTLGNCIDGNTGSTGSGSSGSGSNGSGSGCTKVFYCQVKSATKFKTKQGCESTVLKKIAKHPDKYILGKCEDVISPA